MGSRIFGHLLHIFKVEQAILHLSRHMTRLFGREPCVESFHQASQAAVALGDRRARFHHLACRFGFDQGKVGVFPKLGNINQKLGRNLVIRHRATRLIDPLQP